MRCSESAKKVQVGGPSTEDGSDGAWPGFYQSLINNNSHPRHTHHSRSRYYLCHQRSQPKLGLQHV